jgi:hypothetical protein
LVAYRTTHPPSVPDTLWVRARPPAATRLEQAEAVRGVGALVVLMAEAEAAPMAVGVDQACRPPAAQSMLLHQGLLQLEAGRLP